MTDPDSGGVPSVAFSPGGQVLAASDSNDHVYLWNVAASKRIATLAVPSDGGVQSVGFSPNGKTLAVGDGIVYLWDLAAKRKIATLSDPTPQIADDPSNSSDNATVRVAFSPDGTELAVADAVSNRAYLWDVATRQRIVIFTGHGRNDGGMTSVAFSPGGQALATGEA